MALNPSSSREGVAFRKMHGIGNDFVVLDARAREVALTGGQASAIADRHTGVGCDQIITVAAARAAGADAFMRIQNADGSEVEACGNATRCVADMLMRERGTDRVVIETVVGLLPSSRASGGRIAVDMGPARLGWREIPLAEDCDTLRVPIAHGALKEPVAVGMGNPHAVFIVPDAETAPVAEAGPILEHHRMFPQRANIEFVQVLDRGRLRMRVWERGVGITQACGSGACAAAVAAIRRGLTDRKVQVILDGGTLELEWREDGHVVMTGPVATSFTGELPASLIGGGRAEAAA